MYDKITKSIFLDRERTMTDRKEDFDKKKPDPSVLTDRQKLDMWNDVCVSKGWAKKRELDTWLLKLGINFTSNGSVVPDESYKISNKYNIKMVVDGVTGEHLATLVLEALTGTLIFDSLELEKEFWDIAQRRFREEFEISIPKIVLPPYVKTFAKPKEEN